jgi:hypothetical protein
MVANQRMLRTTNPSHEISRTCYIISSEMNSFGSMVLCVNYTISRLHSESFRLLLERVISSYLKKEGAFPNHIYTRLEAHWSSYLQLMSRTALVHESLTWRRSVNRPLGFGRPVIENLQGHFSVLT